MTKYIIEGNINFYDELYNTQDDNNDDTDNNLCLITQLPLIDKYVELNCGHKFNYEPLYNDIFNHKMNLNNMEKKLLKTYQLRCPYCRNIQNSLLPYYIDLPFKKIIGVNFFNYATELKKNYCFSMDNGICEYEEIKEVNNGDGEIIKIIEKCQNSYVYNIDLINKSYCMHHKSHAILNFLKMEKEKKQNQKIQEKIKLKEEKMNKMKEEKMNKLKEVHINTCSHILKTGKNKNSLCSGKCYKDNLCFRHYKNIKE